MRFLDWLIGFFFGKDFFNFKSKESAKLTTKTKKDYRLKPGCKYWYFNKYGRDTGHIVFTCLARNFTNAFRKFNNYKALND